MTVDPPGAAPQTPPPPLPHPAAALRCVAFVDVVDSVRLVDRLGSAFIDRWRETVRHLRDEMLPAQGGRLASHRGDGAILVFDTAPQAVATMCALSAWLAERNSPLAADERIALRGAVHRCEVLVDEIDAFGAGVNVAARLAAQAQPGQTLITVDAAEQLHPALDPAVEDLGELWLKHLAEPVRAYRLLCDDEPSSLLAPPPDDALRPTLAVLPFEQPGAPGAAIGELLADELICALSPLPEIRVVSRLSAAAAAARSGGLGGSARPLAADYVLGGRCHLVERRVVLHAELFETARGEVVESWRVAGDLASLPTAESPLVASLLERLGTSLLRRQVELARRCPLPNLAGYSLLLAGISLMHRLSRHDIARAHDLLSHLCERWPRLAAPHAWRARWHLFNLLQGISKDTAADHRAALDASRRALDADPRSSVALAVAGSVRVGLDRDVDGGLDLYRDAVDANPSDSLAWMLMGTAHAFKGEGAVASRAATQAGRLSPLDPLHFLYDCHAAGAALAADDSARALALAERSLRANGQHLSTLRVLAIAQMLEGRGDEARITVARLLRLHPQHSVGAYLRQSPSGAYPIGRRFAALLAEAGLPRGD